MRPTNVSGQPIRERNGKLTAKGIDPIGVLALLCRGHRVSVPAANSQKNRKPPQEKACGAHCDPPAWCVFEEPEPWVGGVPNKTTTKEISLIGRGTPPPVGWPHPAAGAPPSLYPLSPSLPHPRASLRSSESLAPRCVRCARTAGRCRPLGRFQRRRSSHRPATPAKKGARQGGRTGGPLLQRPQCRASIGRAAPLSLERVCE
jgi:hypothetical protein